jgi:hypothetical protein
MGKVNAVLCIFGSRSLSGVPILEIIKSEAEKHQAEYIVTSGEPVGVCRTVQVFCRQEGYPLKLHFLQKKWGRGAFHHRSLAILKECDHCVLIHDGISKGTQNELDLCRKLGKPYTYHQIERQPTALKGIFRYATIND